METIKLLYPDWIVIAVIAFLIILCFVAIIYFCISIKELHYISSSASTEDVIYFIKDVDGDNLINAEEIEQISQRYNRESNKYEIVYYLKSLHTITESFNNEFDCRERFDEITQILNDYNY